jgi:small GTP-binding protein
MKSLPTSVREINRLLNALEIKSLREEIRAEAAARVSIVGPVNSGKSTLFNFLRDKMVSETSPVPGTTKKVIVEHVGPFTLLDTPGMEEVFGDERAEIAWETLATASIVIVVFDASAGIRKSDYDLLQRVLSYHKPTIVTLNKIDLVGSQAERVSLDAEAKLRVPVIPISAKKGTNIGSLLVPEVIAQNPEVAVLIGRELPVFRDRAAKKIIREAVMLNAAAGAEPFPLVDIPVLLATQVRMMLRLAALYGEDMSTAHVKELISTIAGGLAFRYLAEQGVKLIPALGWAVASGIAGASTYAIGRAAQAYFESGRRIKPRELRSIYRKELQQAKKEQD